MFFLVLQSLWFKFSEQAKGSKGTNKVSVEKINADRAALGTRQCISFARSTTWKHVRASVTSKNSKSVKASVSKWNSYNEYSHNAYSNTFFGLKTRSRFRWIIVACPALRYMEDWEKMQRYVKRRGKEVAVIIRGISRVKLNKQNIIFTLFCTVYLPIGSVV